MGFAKIFWQNDAQGAFLPKISISGQIALEIFLSPVMVRWLHTNPFKFDLGLNI